MQKLRSLETAVFALLLLAPAIAPAQRQTVEQVAQTIAAQHNANSLTSKDEMVASSSARAIGKNVTFENVLRVQQGLSQAKLREFADYARNEVIPKTCQVPGNHLGFDRGMSYTFVYKSEYGELLTQFNVDKTTCEKWK